MKTLREFFTGRKEREMVQNKDNTLVTGPQTHYYCPMKCEGEKTYNAPGNCPVCNMKLVQVTEKGSNVHKHEHDAHGHSHHGCC